MPLTTQRPDINRMIKHDFIKFGKNGEFGKG